MQSDLPNVSAKGSTAMMILAMNIVSDCSADGYVPGAGSDGKKPSAREKYVDNIGEADTAFTTQHPSGFVESKDAVETAAVDEFTTRI
jgi:hypothetical protein